MDVSQVLQALNENSAIDAEVFGQHFSATGLVPCLLVAVLIVGLLRFALRRRYLHRSSTPSGTNSDTTGGVTRSSLDTD